LFKPLIGFWYKYKQRCGRERRLMKAVLALGAVLMVPASVVAQTAETPGASRRFVVDAAAGFGTTWDDEGLLGRGFTIAGGAGVQLTPQWAVRAFVDRIAYYRDEERLTFDGRVVVAGAEASVRLVRRGVSPCLTFGAGVLNDSGIWVRKTQAGPSQPRIDERIHREGSAAAMTVSGGVDVPVSARMAIRGGLRFYGLLDTGDDLFPHVILEPALAVVFTF
jgi:hypothetical protein